MLGEVALSMLMGVLLEEAVTVVEEEAAAGLEEGDISLLLLTITILQAVLLQALQAAISLQEVGEATLEGEEAGEESLLTLETNLALLRPMVTCLPL